MAAQSIVKGENVLTQRNLKYSDGTTDLLLSDCASIKARLKRASDVLKEYIYPDSDFRQGDTGSQIELEVGTNVSSELPTGNIDLEIEIVSVNGNYNEGFQKDILREEFLIVHE